MNPVPARTRWWQGLTRTQWLILTVAFLGWVFDIMDVSLFNFAKAEMLKELVPAAELKAHGAQIDGIFLTILLIGWSAGGLIFGVLADRW